jgi:hypothetical protein
MPFYNSDCSLALNLFAHFMVVLGAITVAVVFVNVCWWIFCQTFKLVDGIVNDYYYD